MSLLDRRRFLQLASGALASYGLGCSSDDEAPTTSGSGAFGVPVGDAAQAMVPEDRRPDGVLELFLMGGLNPWDSFYVTPGRLGPGTSSPHAGQQWWTYQDGEDSVPEVFARCGGAGDLTSFFGTDSGGVDVHLGPWVRALADRPDIVGRMRIVVVAHDLEPHEAAVPLCVAGHPRGSPRLASTGAHVQRFLTDSRGGPDGLAPESWVLFPNSDTVGNFNVESAAALGGHPGYARPLSIQLAPRTRLPEQLQRTTLGGRADAVDAAVEWYYQRLRRGFIPPDADTPVRSAGLDRWRDARAALAGAPALAQTLPAEILASNPGEACGFETETDRTRLGLDVATHLLTRPERPARYVHVIDSGLKEANNGGYDTHEHHVRDASVSVTHLSRQLAARINTPGENDPNKLDLDRHLVALTTEMGRTPYPQKYSTRGLNHWPYGFVVVLIGGPIQTPAISGHIGEDGRAITGLTPAELRAGLLLAQGIWPFNRESFDRADMPDPSNNVTSALRIRERLLGIPA